MLRVGKHNISWEHASRLLPSAEAAERCGSPRLLIARANARVSRSVRYDGDASVDPDSASRVDDDSVDKAQRVTRCAACRTGAASLVLGRAAGRWGPVLLCETTKLLDHVWKNREIVTRVPPCCQS